MRARRDKGQYDFEAWKPEVFLAKHCNGPVGTSVSGDVRNYRLYHCSSRDHEFCDFLHYGSPHQRHGYSTRALRTHATIKVSGENEAASHAYYSHSLVAGRCRHDRPNCRAVQLRSLYGRSAISLPGRNCTLHHSRRDVLHSYDRGDKATAHCRASGEVEPARKNRWLSKKG